MKKIPLFLALFAFCLSLLAGIGGEPAMQGKITSIEKTDKQTTAIVRMDASSSLTKAPEEKVRPGMSVRLIYSIETAQFRPGIGRVLLVRENGDVLVSVDENLLNKEIVGPNSSSGIKVKELFRVGAQVSISGEAL